MKVAGATGQPPDELLARLRRGARCFGTKRDGHVVAVRWAARGEVDAEYLRVGLRLPPGDAWIFDSWTDPEDRGQGVAAEASAALGAALAEEGTTRLVAMVMGGNRAGMAAIRRSGYGALGTITTVRASRGRRAVRFRALGTNGQP